MIALGTNVCSISAKSSAAINVVKLTKIGKYCVVNLADAFGTGTIITHRGVLACAAAIDVAFDRGERAIGRAPVRCMRGALP